MLGHGGPPVAATAPHAAGPRPAPAPGQTPERGGWVDGARERWPLIGLLAVAAALRFATIGHQSLWYDEAFTAVHVLRSSLGATLHDVLHTESTPPLYYVLEWAWTRVVGDGAVGLRSLSAAAGVGTVAVAWAVGNVLRERRGALWLGALAATSPLLVWYSQEARAYSLFALMASLSFWFFLRARTAEEASARDLWAWAVFSVLALLTFYFAAFLVAAEAILLLIGSGLPRGAPRRHVPAAAAVAVAALALIPLVVTQTGHAQWIGRWALGNRLIAIFQYFLLTPSTRDAPLGHGVVAVVSLPVLASLLLVPRLLPGERRMATLCAIVAGVGIGVPIALAIVGVDVMAPRNLIGAWAPAAGAFTVIASAERNRLEGGLLAAVVCVVGLGMVIDVNVSPKLQRGDWSAVAGAVCQGLPARAIVTPDLGSAPLEYYAPPLHKLVPGASVRADEIDLIGYSPLVHDPLRPPAPGFTLVARSNFHGLLVERFQASRAQTLTEHRLAVRHLVRGVRTQVLVPGR